MKINEYIDHTNLKQISTKEDIKKLCNEAINNGFACVCISPYYVKYAHDLVKGTNIKVCAVIGFPNGYNTTNTKVFETKDAINNGADEIDMVININALKNKDYDYIINEINEMRNVTKGHILKVIVETALLSKKELIKMTKICNNTKVDYIKTSTGFSTRGASLEDIEIINSVKNKDLKVKASGGIKTYNDAINYINLGVSRIGTSSGCEIIKNS